ncbi:hypothetical protein AGMMS4952_12680 [Spirochaetia bacterium]|nr:hypothetical protein AGMMS4952_12680 [Spirochaetia bacterium]
MKVKTLIPLFAVLLLFAGCGGNAKNKLAGDWSAVANDLSYRMILQSDGTGEMDIGGISFILKYTADAETITFTIDRDVLIDRYTLSPNRKTLFIKNLFDSGVDVHFTRRRLR